MRSQLDDDLSEVSSAFVMHEARKLYFPETEGRTREEFAEDCDINVIMARYEKTGVISHNSPREPRYVDFTEIPDNLQEALTMLDDAKASFMELPASVRREFDNDPMQFVEYASDPSNLDQMREWGLAPPRAASVSPPVGEPAPAPGTPSDSPADGS